MILLNISIPIIITIIIVMERLKHLFYEHTSWSGLPPHSPPGAAGRSCGVGGEGAGLGGEGEGLGGWGDDGGAGRGDACRLHYGALSLLRPGVVLLVRCVDQGVTLLVLLHELPHRCNASGQRPALHRGLVLHVLDLLLQRVLVHEIGRAHV